MTAAPTERRHVWQVPREPRQLHTPFGDAVVTVGSGFDEVVVTATGPAARELAQLIAASTRLRPVEDQPAEADTAVWDQVVVDLLACAAMCDPSWIPTEARLVRLEGVAR